MAENRKEAENGVYYFKKSQAVAVAAGFAATAALVFLLGIVVGQGIEERKLRKQEEPLVKVPLQPGTKTAQATPGKDELTFYDTLGGAPRASQPPVAPAVPAVKETKPAEKVAKAEPPPAKEPETKEAQEAKPVKETKAVKTAGAAETTPPAPQKTKEKAEKVAAAENGKEAAEKSAEAEKKTDPAARVWTVQVNAYPEESRAQKLAERLKEKGYEAYVVAANVKGKEWYRVRVGRFPTRAKARELVEELQTKENFTKAIAVSR